MPRKDSILKIRLPEALKLEAERIADAKGETLSYVLREALRQYLDRHPWETTAPVSLLLPPSQPPPAPAADSGPSRPLAEQLGHASHQQKIKRLQQQLESHDTQKVAEDPESYRTTNGCGPECTNGHTNGEQC